MKVTQELLEQIDQYLDGSLSGTPLKEFEDRLQSDTGLKALVEEQRLIIRSINKKELSDVRKKLSSFHEGLNSENTTTSTQSESIERTLPKRNPIGKWLAIAASILLLVGSYFMFFSNSSNTSNEIVNQVEQEQEDLVASSGDYKKIPVQNKAGLKKGTISLLITPSEKEDFQYTLSKDLLVLFINKERIPSVESISFFKEESPLTYFLQLEGKYYKLVETQRPTTAKETDFD